MDIKKWINNKPNWLKFGIMVSAIYSVGLIFVYVTTFMHLPYFLSLFTNELQRIFYPQIYLFSEIYISTLLYEGNRFFNILFGLLEIVLTIVIGFVIGASIGHLRKK